MTELRHALRSLRRSPGVSASTAVTLALGTALSAPILAWARAGLAAPAAPELRSFDRIPGAPGGGWSEEVVGAAVLVDAGLDALLWTVLAVSVVVAAGAAVNLTSLLLSEANGRRHETALRAALGATPWRLMRQKLLEGALLGVAGGGAGIALGVLVGSGLRRSWPDVLPTWEGASGAPWVVTACGLVGVVLLGASVPAWGAQGRKLRAVLAAGGRATAGPGDGLLRRALTVLQFAASVTLLVGAMVLVRGSARSPDAAPLGFDPRDTLTLRLDLTGVEAAERAAAQERILAGLRTLPGVRAVAAGTPGAWLGIGPEDALNTLCVPTCVAANTYAPMLAGVARHHAVTPGFFRTLGLEVLEGRELTLADEAASEPSAVINRAFASRLLPFAEPVGSYVMLDGYFGRRLPVVGVVDDTRTQGIGSEGRPRPTVYLSSLRHPPRELELAVRTGNDPRQHADAARRAVRAAAPAARITTVSTMEEELARFRAPLRWFGALLGGLATAAVALAAAGLYAVMRASVTRRRREMGIRMALGATERTILGQVLWEGVRVTAWGSVLGGIGALTLARMLQLLFRGMEPLDPVTYLAVAALLGAVTLGASYLPARRATRADPMIALRAD